MIGKAIAGASAAVLLLAAGYVQFAKEGSAVTFPALGDEDYCGPPNKTSVVASVQSPQVAFMTVCTAPGRGALGPMVNTLVVAAANSSPRSFPIGGDLNPTMLGYDNEDQIYWATTWSDETKAFTDQLTIFALSSRDGAMRSTGHLELPFQGFVAGATQGESGWLLKVASPRGERSIYVGFAQGRLTRLPDAPARRVLFWSQPASAFIAASLDHDLRIDGVYGARLGDKASFDPLTAVGLQGEEMSTSYASAPKSPVVLRIRKLGVDDTEAELLGDLQGGALRSWRWPEHIYASAMADDGKHFAVVFGDRVEVYRSDGTKDPVGSMRSADASDAVPIFSAPAGGLFVVEQTGVSMIKVGN